MFVDSARPKENTGRRYISEIDVLDSVVQSRCPACEYVSVSECVVRHESQQSQTSRRLRGGVVECYVVW